MTLFSHSFKVQVLLIYFVAIIIPVFAVFLPLYFQKQRAQPSASVPIRDMGSLLLSLVLDDSENLCNCDRCIQI